MKKTLFAGGLMLLLSASLAFAQGSDLPKGLKGVSLGGTYYLHYVAGQTPSGSYNDFAISRGYLTLKKSFGDNLSSRITTDIHQAASGDWAPRLKYIYGAYKFSDMGFITKPSVEFGLVHTPWLDFEEHINAYRVQGTMFMERSGIFNSADVGVTYAGYFGGEMDDHYKKTVSKAYPGRYGSFAIGVYNGGGYHAVENNQNKVVQVRLTGRPVHSGALAGLQVSYLGIFGKGNVAGDLPDYNLTALMLSYQAHRFTATGQYIMGAGNSGGSWVKANGDSQKYDGYSVYANYEVITDWSVMARYDQFDPDTDVTNDAGSRMIFGLGHELDSHNMLLVDYQIYTPENSSIDPSTAFKLSWEIDF